jgi:hypothetical protein
MHLWVTPPIAVMQNRRHGAVPVLVGYFAEPLARGSCVRGVRVVVLARVPGSGERND